MQMYGRSGVNVDGFNPLTYSTLVKWAELNCVSLTSEEVDALFELDGILRHPEEPNAMQKQNG